MLDSFFCWEYILLYGDTYHLILRRGLENEKVDGCDWGVQVVEDFVKKKLFFSDPGTRHPLETSAGTRYLRPEFLKIFSLIFLALPQTSLCLLSP